MVDVVVVEEPKIWRSCPIGGKGGDWVTSLVLVSWYGFIDEPTFSIRSALACHGVSGPVNRSSSSSWQMLLDELEGLQIRRSSKGTHCHAAFCPAIKRLSELSNGKFDVCECVRQVKRIRCARDVMPPRLTAVATTWPLLRLASFLPTPTHIFDLGTVQRN